MRHLAAVLAIVLTVTACNVTPQVNTGTVNNGSGPAAPAQAPAEQKQAPTWGQTYKWSSGLTVEIAAPAACKPSKTAHPQNAARAIKVTYKITNGTDKPFSTSVLSGMTDVQFAGTKAETLIDVSGPCKAGIGLESSTILPGKSFSYDVAYAVTKDPGELQISLQPDFMEDKAIFVGQA
jgi:hypothetical protein